MSRELEHAEIVLSRCYLDRRLFGVRFVRQSSEAWHAVWAFEIDAESAKRERYDDTTLRGTFSFSAEYPGCPHCRAASLVTWACRRSVWTL
jgi:hypothetical protein